MLSEKKCIRCGSFGLHYRNAGKPDGMSTYCRACESEWKKEKRATIPPAMAADAARFQAVMRPAPPEAECADPDYGFDKPTPSAPRPPDAVINETRAEREARTLRAEHRGLADEVERLRATLQAVTGMTSPGPDLPPIIRQASTQATGEAVACMVASDWHVEEPVQPSKVHGINEYNLTIAEARARAFFANGLRLTEMMAREVKLDTLFLFLGGDFISGHIHEELRETNELAPGEAARFVLNLLTKGIEFLIRESNLKLEIDAIPGNHGRMTLKPRIQNATETSLETFLYHSLASRFENNPRVKIRVADSKMLYRKFFDRFTMRLIHGDDVKFGGGIGGVTIPIRKKLAAWDKAVKADLTVMGHFHQLMNGGDFIVNGSLIGYNEFAQAIGASPEEARQAFFLIHNRNGGELSLTAPIWLDRERLHR